MRYRRWRVIARRHPSAFLLAVQLASLVAYPLLELGSRWAQRWHYRDE
jgi:hypothetical protein